MLTLSGLDSAILGQRNIVYLTQFEPILVDF